MAAVNEVIIVSSFVLCIVGFMVANNIYFLKGLKLKDKITKNILLLLISPLTLAYLQYTVSHNTASIASMLFGLGTDSLAYKLIFSFTEILVITILLWAFNRLYSKIIESNLNVCRFIYFLFIIVIFCVDSISFSPLTVLTVSLILLGYNYHLFGNNMKIFTDNIDERAIKRINILPVAVLAMQYILLTFWNIIPDSLASNGKISALSVIMACFSVGLYVFLCLSYKITFNNYEQTIMIKHDSEEKIKTQEEIILAFAEMIEAKSSQTGQHVKRVSEYSYVLAKGMGISEEEAQKIRIASMMHDIGKFFIPSEILEKPCKLTKEEFEIIKTHVTLGENILHNAPGDIMAYAKQIALDHHEKWNGKGYLSKKGPDISLAGRIVAIADVYDALVSKRSYKDAWTEANARKQIISDSGTHFDPKIINAFIENYSDILSVLNSFPDGNAAG
ncbi:MAG: HD domain-containing protein [Oscillospiraceae bacterium]|nr:HD domain-containing protein [Oscillospiraceae bacterium]